MKCIDRGAGAWENTGCRAISPSFQPEAQNTNVSVWSRRDKTRQENPLREGRLYRLVSQQLACSVANLFNQAFSVANNDAIVDG